MSADAPAFVAAAGCSGCPHRTICSEARQRVHDREIPVGRHYLCEFYPAISAARRQPQRAGGRLFDWIGRLGTRRG